MSLPGQTPIPKPTASLEEIEIHIQQSAQRVKDMNVYNTSPQKSEHKIKSPLHRDWREENPFVWESKQRQNRSSKKKLSKEDMKRNKEYLKARRAQFIKERPEEEGGTKDELEQQAQMSNALQEYLHERLNKDQFGQENKEKLKEHIEKSKSNILEDYHQDTRIVGLIQIQDDQQVFSNRELKGQSSIQRK